MLKPLHPKLRIGLQGMLLLIGVLVRVNGLRTVAFRSPDEQIYTFQARVLLKDGLSGIRRYSEFYLSRQERWTTPPPYQDWLPRSLGVGNADDRHIR